MKWTWIVTCVLSLFSLIQADSTFQLPCFDHSDPLDIHKHTNTDCFSKSQHQKRSWYIRSWRKRQTQPSSISSDMCQVTLSCLVNDTNRCSKVENTFNEACQIIMSSLSLQVPILVNASFMNFCSNLGICQTKQGYLTLGGATPARTIPLRDNDNMNRLYPQALVKQFQYSNPPKFAHYDIIAQFNSQADFWFEEDGPIQPDQSHFLFVVLHELIHGLGFTSSWQDYLNDIPVALTPVLIFSQDLITGTVKFMGFIEFAFDRYIKLANHSSLSNFTIQLNRFANGPGAQFSSESALYTAFKESPQYTLAKQMLSYAITPNSFQFVPSLNVMPNSTSPLLPLFLSGMTSIDQGLPHTNSFPQDGISPNSKPTLINIPVSHNKTHQPHKRDLEELSMTLETSLQPFQVGSSISHCDYWTYSNTSDFLMRYLQDRGKTLGQSVREGKNSSLGPIGPILRMTLEAMGYKSSNNPNPYTPSLSESIGFRTKPKFPNFLTLGILIFTWIYVL